MSTIIRIKRRCDEEAQDAIVVDCKRQRHEEIDDGSKVEPKPTVLQFAGTVENQDVDVLKHYKSSKLSVGAQLKSKGPTTTFQSIRERIRDEFYAQSKKNRYKVVNLHRSSVEDAQIAPEKEITIVDVESQAYAEPNSAAAEAPAADQSPAKYVYDLYYTTSDDLGDLGDDQQLVGVYPLRNELVYGSHRDNGYADSDGDQSEDSNAENNWRNDYPDEDEDGRDEDSIQEGDMLAAMRNVHLANELSSDEEVEGFMYSIDSEAAGFEEDVDDSDANRYGERYARFKAKFLKKAKASSAEESDSPYEDAEDRELDNNSSYYD